MVFSLHALSLSHSLTHSLSLSLSLSPCLPLFQDVERRPGDRWMIRGPCEYVPPVEVEVVARRKAMPLDENEGIYVRDVKSGRVSCSFPDFLYSLFFIFKCVSFLSLFPVSFSLSLSLSLSFSLSLSLSLLASSFPLYNYNPSSLFLTLLSLLSSPMF